MKLVLVHGRSQQGKNSDELRAEWLKALAVGYQRAGVSAPTVETSIAYYGDLLAERVAAAEQGLPNDIGSRGPGEGPTGYAATQRALLADVAAAAGVTEQQIAAELAPIGSRDPQNWGWVLAAARALSRIPGLDIRIIDTWLRDVALYMSNAPTQRAVDRVLAAEINTEPYVLVAHSLGSVVAYNVLRNLTTTTCRGLVTLGSPLGIPGIRSRLAAPLRYPPRLGDWYNAYDRADIVALRPLDAEYFPTTPPIENHGGVANFTTNRHGIAGYLADQQVAERIAHLLSTLSPLPC